MEMQPYDQRIANRPHLPRPRVRRAAAVEALERRALMSALGPPDPEPGVFLQDGVLVIVGSNAGDRVTVSLESGGEFRVVLNGATETFPGVSVGAVRAGLLGGEDVLTLGDTGGVTVTLDAGAGTADSLVMSAYGTRLGVRMVPGQVLDDRRDVRYSGLESLTVSTTGNDANDQLDDDDDVTVDQGAAGPATTINTGDGDDSIDVRGGAAGRSLLVNGGADDDVLTFRAGAGPLANLSGGAGEDRFVYLGTDAADTFDVGRFRVGGTGGTATFGSDVESAVLEAGGGNDAVEISSTDDEVHYFVNAGAGDDAITLGGTGSHSVDLISGPVSIDGQAGADRITVDDASTPFGYAYFVDGGAFSRTFTATADYRGVEQVTINGGTGGDSGFNVIPAVGTTITVNGGPPDAPSLPGDILSLRPNGATGIAHLPGPAAGSGRYTFADRQPVIYTGMETLLTDDAVSRVVRRHVFYNHSGFDNNDPEANRQDDFAVATDKQALLPGAAPSYANVTNFILGINGIIIDVEDLVPSGGSLRPDDFVIRTGAGGDPSAWAAGPAPSEVVVRRGETEDGASRIMLVWPDGAIHDTWVQVTVPANTRTGLTTPDVFYFGNLRGETGDNASFPLRVNALDLARVRRDLGRTVPITSPADVTRDGRVNALDLSAVRQRIGRSELPPPTLPAVSAATSPLLVLTVRRRWDPPGAGIL